MLSYGTTQIKSTIGESLLSCVNECAKSDSSQSEPIIDSANAGRMPDIKSNDSPLKIWLRDESEL